MIKKKGVILKRVTQPHPPIKNVHPYLLKPTHSHPPMKNIHPPPTSQKRPPPTSTHPHLPIKNIHTPGPPKIYLHPTPTTLSTHKKCPHTPTQSNIPPPTCTHPHQTHIKCLSIPTHPKYTYAPTRPHSHIKIVPFPH